MSERDDAELVALAALAFAEAAECICANQDREHNGLAMAYSFVTGPGIVALHERLLERGIIP